MISQQQELLRRQKRYNKLLSMINSYHLSPQDAYDLQRTQKNKQLEIAASYNRSNQNKTYVFPLLDDEQDQIFPQSHPESMFFQLNFYDLHAQEYIENPGTILKKVMSQTSLTGQHIQPKRRKSQMDDTQRKQYNKYIRQYDSKKSSVKRRPRSLKNKLQKNPQLKETNQQGPIIQQKGSKNQLFLNPPSSGKKIRKSSISSSDSKCSLKKTTPSVSGSPKLAQISTNIYISQPFIQAKRPIAKLIAPGDRGIENDFRYYLL